MTKSTGPALIGINVDTYDTTAKYPMGTFYEGVNGKAYQYVQFLDAVTYQAGDVVTRAGGTEGDWKVTNDRAGGSAITGHEVVGVLMAAIRVPTQNEYGWVQVRGECAARGTYAAGDFLKPHATADGELVVSGYTAAKADFNIVAKALSSTKVKLCI